MGNSRTASAINGARNYAREDRITLDYYATDPRAVEMLLEKERFSPTVWEPACGGGHISEVLKKAGYEVISSDLADRGYGKVCDFLQQTENPGGIDIITNPPYTISQKFVEHAIRISPEGTKIAMFLKIQFLETQARRRLFETDPPKTVYVSSNRLRCAPGGDFGKAKDKNAMCFAWFVWIKGFQGDPVIKWFN